MSSRTHHKHGTHRTGKLWIVVMFLVLRILDTSMYFGSQPLNRHRLLGEILNGAVWTTVLLVAIWFRKDWARFILAALLLVSVAFLMIAASGLSDIHVSRNFVFLLIGVMVGNLGVALGLICLPSVRRLTGRA